MFISLLLIKLFKFYCYNIVFSCSLIFLRIYLCGAQRGRSAKPRGSFAHTTVQFSEQSINPVASTRLWVVALFTSPLPSSSTKLGWEVVRELLLTILLPAVAEYAQSRQHTAHSTHALPAHAQCRQDTLKVTGRGLARPGLVQQLPVPVRDQGNNIFIAL